LKTPAWRTTSGRLGATALVWTVVTAAVGMPAAPDEIARATERGSSQPGGVGTAPRAPARKSTMTPQQLVARITAKDWTIVDGAATFDAGTASAVAALLERPDPQLRELTVHVLDATDGADARRALLKALNDPDNVVRAAAARFVGRRRVAEDLPAVLQQIQQNPDEYVREQLALAVGKTGAREAIPVLEESLTRERDVHARHAMTLALARLGAPQSRTAVLARLRVQDPKERVAALQDVLYLDDRTLAAEVLPLLDDLRDAKNVAPSHGRLMIRVCDAAVNTLDVLLGHPFPFPVSGVQRYTPEQLAQAKSIVAGRR